MKKFNANKELDKAEKALWNTGSKLSKPFIARAKELIVEISKGKGIKIERLVMGMGCYSLVGTIPFKEVWSGGVEEGEHEIEMWRLDSGRNCMLEYYDAVNPGISALLGELNEVLSILTHTRYLQVFDIDKNEMKKLLKRS